MNYIDINSKVPKGNSNSMKVKDEDAINNSIRNIFNTRIGTVPGNPEFGSNILKFLFEQINPMTIEVIKSEVKYSLQRWEERVNLTEVKVTEDPDYNRLKVKIVYSIKKDVTSSQYSYIFSVQTS